MIQIELTEQEFSVMIDAFQDRLVNLEKPDTCFPVGSEGYRNVEKWTAAERSRVSELMAKLFAAEKEGRNGS